MTRAVALPCDNGPRDSEGAGNTARSLTHLLDLGERGLGMEPTRYIFGDPTGERRLALRVRREGECIRWTGAHNPVGYGQISIDGRVCQVHRVAWELHRGPIPDGMEIDHVQARGCEFRDCVNVDHMEVVTHHENLRRIRKGRSRCANGHEYTPGNVRMHGDRHVCLTCIRERSERKLRRERKLSQPPEPRTNCLCGCGTLLLPGRRWVRGHNRRVDQPNVTKQRSQRGGEAHS